MRFLNRGNIAFQDQVLDVRGVQHELNGGDALLNLYKAGTITLEEAMSHADSRSNLEAKVNFGVQKIFFDRSI